MKMYVACFYVDDVVVVVIVVGACVFIFVAVSVYVIGADSVNR